MADPPRCGNCGRYADVKYEWFGAHYGETIACENCGPKAVRYDPFAAALAEMDDEEVKALAEGEAV